MLGSPGMDSLSGASDMKYPGDCYSPKYVDQRDTYRGRIKIFLFLNLFLFSVLLRFFFYDLKK